MFISVCKSMRLIACTVMFVGFQQPLHAKTEASITDNVELKQLVNIVNDVLKRNPELQASYAKVEAAKARLQGARLPLNNPELELEAEKTDVDTYSIGISQTIDWHSKQNALEIAQKSQLDAALASARALRLEKAGELLKAIGDVIALHNITTLSKQRTEIIERFSNVAKKLHSAGDISSAELEMAKLSLAESVMQHATHGEDLIEAKISFTEISGQSITSNIQFPQQLPGKLPPITDVEKTLQNHPKVRLAYLSSQAIRQQMHFTEQDRKADPTVGVSVGREDNEDLIGITFSMPLQVRNDFSHNVDAAIAETLQAEKEARQTYQALSARLNGAFERYNLVAHAWNVWVNQGRQSLKQRLESLDIQWKAGEINTTDYLLQLQQTLDIQMDGVELQGKLWDAWVEWLMTSNKLSVWLDQIIKE